MSNFFLTPDEVKELTEFSRCKDQCKWLAHNGIKFLVGRTGRPKIPRAAVFEALGIKGSKESVAAMPDIDALQRVTNGT